jgi:hypothetical protein
MIRKRVMHKHKCHLQLKPDLAADHAAKAGATGPAAAYLAFNKKVAVLIADSDTTGAAVALVVGIERTRKAGGRGARVGVRNANGLHWRAKRWWGFSKGVYNMCLENIFISFFR